MALVAPAIGEQSNCKIAQGLVDSFLFRDLARWVLDPGVATARDTSDKDFVALLPQNTSARIGSDGTSVRL